MSNPEATRLPGCEWILLYPQGYFDGGESGCSMPDTYRGVRDKWATYAALLAEVDSYRELLACLATYTGVDAQHEDFTQVDSDYANYEELLNFVEVVDSGNFIRPVGVGVEFGVVLEGVEWWTSGAEGLVDSAPWEVVTEDPALMDGSWALTVRSSGREVTLNATLVGSREGVAGAIGVLRAVFAAPPRVGWLTWKADEGDRKLSVALSGPTRSRWSGAQSAEVEMPLKGVDLGTPGAGVHLEGEEQVFALGSVATKFEVGGTIPTYPNIRLMGPIGAGSLIDLNGYSGRVVKDIPLRSELFVDCRSKQMWLDDVPDRSYLQWNQPQWPLLTAPYSEMRAVLNDVDGVSGSIRVEVTPLW